MLLVSTLLIIFFHENCSSSDFRAHFSRYFAPSAYRALYPAFFWYGCSFLVLGIIPYFLGRSVLGRNPGELGIGLGDWRLGLKALVIMYFAFLPVLVAISYSHAFQAKYPLFDEAERSLAHLVIYEAAYVVYFIGWEYMFRGFMLFGLRPALGLYSVFVQTIPFAILHFGKPQLETFAAVFAGVLLGYLALATRSFWYGWLLHSLIAVTNDILAVVQGSRELF